MELRDSVSVNCSCVQAEQALPRVFASHRAADGSIRLPLRVSLRHFGLPDELAVERDVTVHVRKQRDEANLNDIFKIDWSPANDGPYPSFSGSLIVWGEDDPRHSFIEVMGSYEPPFGTMGELFDAAMGYRIAKHTAHEFLIALASQIERVAAETAG